MVCNSSMGWNETNNDNWGAPCGRWQELIVSSSYLIYIYIFVFLVREPLWLLGLTIPKHPTLFRWNPWGCAIEVDSCDCHGLKIGCRIVPSADGSIGGVAYLQTHPNWIVGYNIYIYFLLYIIYMYFSPSVHKFRLLRKFCLLWLKDDFTRSRATFAISSN